MPVRSIAFLGDIVGKPGRRAVEQQLPRIVADHRVDVVIVNAENARSGSGLSPSIYARLRAAGVHAVTLGDHALRDSSLFDILFDADEPVARPANLSERAPGKGFILLEPLGFPRPILIVTVLGRILMNLPADDPFACVDDLLAKHASRRPIVIVEVHAETTSEKIAIAHHLSGRVAAVIGTHTHVPTADARVLKGGTAFITDAGMCGPYDSVIGRDKDAVVRHMTTHQHVPYPVASDDARVCGVIVRVDDGSGRALSIERIEYAADHNAAPFVY
ncbi:MAG: TIGR00282 family metallophosphoesterase [Phycisphaerales bacterium]